MERTSTPEERGESGLRQLKRPPAVKLSAQSRRSLQLRQIRVLLLSVKVVEASSSDSTTFKSRVLRFEPPAHKFTASQSLQLSSYGVSLSLLLTSQSLQLSSLRRVARASSSTSYGSEPPL